MTRLILSDAIYRATPMGHVVTIDLILHTFQKKGIEVVYFDGRGLVEPLRKRVSHYLSKAKQRGEFEGNGDGKYKRVRAPNAAKASPTIVAAQEPAVPKPAKVSARKPSTRTQTTTTMPPVRDDEALKALIRKIMKDNERSKIKSRIEAIVAATQQELNETRPAVELEVLKEVLSATVSTLGLDPDPGPEVEVDLDTEVLDQVEEPANEVQWTRSGERS